MFINRDNHELDSLNEALLEEINCLLDFLIENSDDIDDHDEFQYLDRDTQNHLSNLIEKKPTLANFRYSN